MARVVIRKPAYDFAFNNPNGMVGRHLASKGRKLEVLAKAQVGVRTGALRASIHMRHMRDPRGQYVMVGSRLNYALMHHEGTKPHLIVANNAKVLRFVKGSSIVYAHSVMHPGTKANRYLSDNLRKVM
jgi:hypothetical protein